MVQPLLWSGVALLILLLSRLGPHRLSFSGVLLPLAFLAGAFQVAVLISGGILTGLGHSPHFYDTPLSILRTAAFVFSTLLGLELTRAYLLSALGRQRPLLMMSVTALLFSFMGVTLAKITSIQSGAAATSFLGDTGLPLLAENLLASYLALLGGPLPAMAYRAIPQAFEWFSPVLPDLGWAPQAFLGTIAPLIGFLAVRSVLEVRSVRAEEGKEEIKAKVGGRPRPAASVVWVGLGIIGVATLWFSMGLFDVYPGIVIGRSMIPTLHNGDLVVMQTVSPDSIGQGDIIEFDGDRGRVIHRVIAVEGTGLARSVTTQGDARAGPDAPILATQVKGKVIFYIPKLGLSGVVIKDVIVKAAEIVSGSGGD